MASPVPSALGVGHKRGLMHFYEVNKDTSVLNTVKRARTANGAAVGGGADGALNGSHDASVAPASPSVGAAQVVAQQPPTPDNTAAAAAAGATTPRALPSALSSAASRRSAATQNSRSPVRFTPHRFVQSPAANANANAAAVDASAAVVAAASPHAMPSPMPVLNRLVTPQYAYTHASAAVSGTGVVAANGLAAGAVPVTPERWTNASVASASASPSFASPAASAAAAAGSGAGAVPVSVDPYARSVVQSVKHTLHVLREEFDPSNDMRVGMGMGMGWREVIDADAVDDSEYRRRLERRRRAGVPAGAAAASAAYDLVPLPPAYGLDDDDDDEDDTGAGVAAYRSPDVRRYAAAVSRAPATVLFSKLQPTPVVAAAAAAELASTPARVQRGTAATAVALASPAFVASAAHGRTQTAAAAAARSSAAASSVLLATPSRLGAAVQELDNRVTRTETDATRELQSVTARDSVISDIERQIAAISLAAADTKAKEPDPKKKPLSAADEQRVKDVFAMRADKLLVSGFNIDMTSELLQCLKGLSWLNDEVVNFYMNLLQERADRALAAPTPANPKPLRCYFLNSFFYAKLVEHNTYRYANVKRWSKKAKINVVQQCDLVLVPVHIHNNHWTLATIDFRHKTFAYYDSMSGTNAKCLQHLRAYVADEAKEHAKLAAYDLSGWRDVHPAGIPQQKNGADCGVFTLKFADYLSEDKPLDFSQQDMPYFRRRICAEILSKHVL